MKIKTKDVVGMAFFIPPILLYLWSVWYILTFHFEGFFSFPATFLLVLGTFCLIFGCVVMGFAILSSD